MKPLVAIVGRPNVGKSTLFNRLVRRRLAIVEDVPGVTRDRHYADTEWGDKAFTVIDTGGFVPDETEVLARQVREQARAAVEECDVVLFVVDGKAGVSSVDQEVADDLRRSGKPTLLVVNKVDDERRQTAATADFYAFGLRSVLDVSAEHGRGMAALIEALVDLLPPSPPQPEDAPEDDRIRVAIVGRPNVGKSTLVNALLAQQRLITSDVPGTTRDPIDSQLVRGARRFVLTDTAGIRRKSTLSQRMEQFAVLAALRAIERSDVAVLLVDATEPAVDQDAHIAGIAEEKGRALVVVVNKWDLVKGKTREDELRAELKRTLSWVAYAPVLFTSAITGSKVEKVLELAALLYDQQRFRVPTPRLNRLLAHIVNEHPAPFSGGRPLRLYYCAQVATAPPTFLFTANRPRGVPDRYQRYVVNQLRRTFDLKVPIRLLFRERPGKAKREAKVARMRGRKKR